MAAVKDYPVHPLSEIIPKMEPDEYADFKASVERAGKIFKPIILLDGKILDGRHRHRVARELRIPCGTEDYAGKKDVQSLTSYVKAMNVDRRHLSSSQRQACAAELSRYLQRGDDEHDETAAPLMPAKEAVTIAAETFGVSIRSVEKARKLQDEAPKKFDEVKRGKTTVNDATEELKEKKTDDLRDKGSSVTKAYKADAIKDAVKNEVPDHLADTFNSSELMSLAGEIRGLKKRVHEIRKSNLGVFISEQTEVDLENAAKAMSFAQPHALCPYCLPVGSKGCKSCRKSGWLNEDAYNNLPKEDRA